MKRDPLRVLIIVLIALGVFISIDLSLARINIEQENKQVEIAVEYGEVDRISRWGNLSLEDMMIKLKEKGATGVLFKEEALGDLDQRLLWFRSGKELIAEHNLTGNNLAKLDPNATYIITSEQGVYQRLVRELEAKTPRMEAIELGDIYAITSSLGVRELKILGLGFDERGIQAARSAGLNILLQIQSWPQATPEAVAKVMKDALTTEGLTGILFNDRVLPGYPASLEALLQELKKSQVPIGLIEFMPQQGLPQLVQNLDKRAVRLHAISEGELIRLTPDKAIARFSLAATERNNRILMLRFFSPTTSNNWAEYNFNFVQDLRSKLEKEGFTFGAATPMKNLPVSRTKIFFLGLAVISGLVLLMEKFIPMKYALVLAALGVLFWGALLMGGFLNLGRLGMALGAVIVFPTLALIKNLKTQGAGLKGSIKLLLKTSFYSLIGAVLLAGLLTDTGFLLKIQEFRGVKLAHILPLLILVAFCFLWQEREKWQKSLKGFFNAKISVGWAFLGGILAIGLLIYISRTGNESAAVSNLELQFRALLDQLLVVRPRTKEFLIGHPILLLVFYLGYQHKYLPILILGAIGQVSLVNTFAHMHTPLLISLFRAFNGLWLGIGVGIVIVLGYKWLVKLGERVEDGS